MPAAVNAALDLRFGGPDVGRHLGNRGVDLQPLAGNIAFVSTLPNGSACSPSRRNRPNEFGRRTSRERVLECAASSSGLQTRMAWRSRGKPLIGLPNEGRMSNKLRTYLRAAYQCAIDVRVTAAISVAFKAYGVQTNPVAQTRRDGRFDRADKRPF